MKILYLITSLGHGQGGHLYCLRDLVKNLEGSGVEPVIAVIGDGKATRVFDRLVCRKFFFLMRRADEMGMVLAKLESVVRAEAPDALHSCSNTALFAAMYLSKIYRIPLVHTQPHGLRPDFFPRIPYLITYSKEGTAYFSGDPKYREMRIFCFPNRVARVVPDRMRIEKLRKELKFPSGFVFLRIARICEMYKESFLKTIALVQKLNDEGIQANALIVGVNEQPWVYEELKRHESSSVKVVVDEEYTHDADDLMDIADCVVGAGNSFMAAASLGKILLTAPSFTRYPVLVSRENFDRFFSYNFRCTFPRPPDFELDESERYEALKELLTSASARKTYGKFSLELFNRHFDVKNFVEEYKHICRDLQYRSLAGAGEHYLRLMETLRATSERVADGIGAWRLRFIGFGIIARMYVTRLRRSVAPSFENCTYKIVKLAVAKNLEVRELRLGRKTYDLVVLVQAHNEEKLIERFLTEAVAVADGIVMLDDGSADRTNELAVHEKMILKLRKRDHSGFDDLANRNLLLSFAEHIPARWFLFLDVDEIVDERYRALLAKTLQTSDAEVIEVGIVNLWGDERHVRADMPPPSVNGVLWRPRLFRKKSHMEIRSSQKLHFQLVPYPTEKTARRGIMVRHYASMTVERRKMRYERYRREDPDHRSQKSYEHIIAGKVTVKPIEDAYEEVDRVALEVINKEGS